MEAVSSYLAISTLPVNGARSIGGVFSVALSPGYPEFPLGTTVPCGVRTFLSGTGPERPCVRPETCLLHLLIYSLIGEFIGPFILGPGNMGDGPGRDFIEQCLDVGEQGL